MAKSETAQIAQLDERIKSLDANIKQLITDVDAFKDRLSKTNSSGIEQMRQEYQSLQKKVEEVGTSQAKTAKKVEEQIQRVSRSRRVDNKILERQNQLLAAQKRLAATGDIGQRFSTLRNSIGGIDFNSILAKANAPTDKGFKMLHESVTSGSETAVRRFASAQNEAKKSVEKTTSSIKAQKSSLESMLPTLRRLASAFGVAFSVQGLVNFGKKLVETRGEFELQQVALRSILQNKQLADEIWDKTMQAALQSPFTAMQLTKYTKQLAAYRIETDKLFDTTKRLADVSAGLGVDMQRLILAYGQVKAANYLRASEIRQFTEAGVNILGELSTYFSKTRGEMISTAQVMDMVQKRMVKFEDVEAIFKRMTDEGGIFYNMQYVQSQTVKGQINKLHDAYDQMLNSIGKANEGTLKNMVAILNNIVKNWREWKTILDTIAWPAIGLALAKFSTGLWGVGASSVVATSGISALTKAGARLQIVLKRLMLNPWIAGASVAIAGVSWVINHAKAVKALNDRYDELNVRAIETKNNFDDYTKTVEDNNNKIRENQSILKTARRGSEEYEKAQNDLNEAQKSNSGIVAKLNTDYPEIAEKVSMANDNWVDLGDSIRIANEELENTILLNQMAKATFGNADLQSDISNAIESANKRLQIAAENRAKALKKIAQGTASDLDKAIANARDWAEQVAIIRQYEQGHWENQWMGAERGVQEVFVKRASGYKIPGEQGLQTTSQQLVKIRDDIKQQDMALREELHTVLMANKEFAKKITEEYEGNYEAFIEGNRKAVEKYMKYGEGEGWKMWNKFMVNYYSNAWGQKDVSQAVISSVQNLRPYGLDLLIDPNKQKTTSGSDQETPKEKQAKIDAAWRRRIQLLEEMKKRYDELSKSAYGYAKSEMTVRQAFDDVRDANGNVIEKGAFSTIFAGTGITMDQIDFTSMEGMFKSMRLALQQAKGISDAVRDEIMKKIDSYEAQITINAKVKIREDFGKEIEQMFSDYELTLDLQKVNLPKRELEEIFGFDLTSTDDIRKAVDKFYNRQMALGADPTDLIKQVEGYYKKLDDMDRKSLLDRLKMYTEYLTEGRDKAVQIHLDELNKMADLDELYAKGYYTKTQYDNILGKIRKETDEKLSKNEWQQFKESDYYVTMFEDLGNVATGSIDLMLQQLKNLKSRLKDLDPTQVKEIVKAIENLEKTRRARSPFKTFLDDLKTLRKWRKTGNRQSELDYLIPKAEEQERTLKGLEEIAAQYEKEYDDIVHGKKEGNESLVKVQWDDATEAVNKAKEELKQTKDVIDEINTANNEGYAAWMRTYQGVARGAQYFSDMANTAGTIATEMMDMFDGVSNASKQLAHDIADIASNTAALGGDIAKAIASEGTDVGSMIDGLVRTWNIIKGVSSASEANINRIVERETIRLENLERSLERVKRARDKAWDTVTVVQNEKEVEHAINDQIAAYDALIAAERSRKNPNDDTLRQWKNEREQLYEQLEEEREEFLKKFGGIGESDYLSAAEGFVDAWKSAFLETGDGLQGLEDHFDEFMQDWFTKQATMRVAGNMLEPLFRQIDAAVDRYGTGGTDAMLSKIARVREMAAAIFPDLSLALEDLAGMFGVGGEGSLSGLAAGIQGMTEEQANILEAYWNSVRMYNASIDMNVARLVTIVDERLGVQVGNAVASNIAPVMAMATAMSENAPSTNPQLQQLQLIAASVQATHQLLQSTSRSGHPMGGYGFKVFND